jgi:hypothetical protein
MLADVHDGSTWVNARPVAAGRRAGGVSAMIMAAEPAVWLPSSGYESRPAHVAAALGTVRSPG